MHQQLSLFNSFSAFADKVQAAHIFPLYAIRIRLQTFGLSDPGHDVLMGGRLFKLHAILPIQRDFLQQIIDFKRVNFKPFAKKCGAFFQ